MRLALAAAALALVPTGLAAQLLPTVHELPANLAAQAVVAAVEACAAQGHHVTATIVDQSGLIKAVLHGDGASPHTLDSARGKAYTAATFAPISKLDSTAEIAKRLLAGPGAPLGNLPGMLLVPGGLAVKTGNEVIGGIGVAGAPGGELDEGCARAGLEKIAGKLGR
jgi:uncharacterized protein GlcG (DUF336 family)